MKRLEAVRESTKVLSYQTLWKLSSYREDEEVSNFYVLGLVAVMSPRKEKEEKEKSVPEKEEVAEEEEKEKEKSVPTTSSTSSLPPHVLQEVLPGILQEVLLGIFREVLQEVLPDVVREANIGKDSKQMPKSLPKKRREGILTGRQAAALVLRPGNVETVTCRLCDWGGCGTDIGFKKHMEVKHSEKPEYWLIPPAEFKGTGSNHESSLEHMAEDDEVILLHKSKPLARGRVTKRSLEVHGKELLAREERVLVTFLMDNTSISHPCRQFVIIVAIQFWFTWRIVQLVYIVMEYKRKF